MSFKKKNKSTDYLKTVQKATVNNSKLPKRKHVDTLIITTKKSDAYFSRQVADALLKRMCIHSWQVALKSLSVTHILLREGDQSYFKVLLDIPGVFGSVRNHNDQSSNQAYEMTRLVRVYAKYLEKKIDVYGVTGKDYIHSSTAIKTAQLSSMMNDVLFDLMDGLQSQTRTLLKINVSDYNLSLILVKHVYLLVLKDVVRLYVLMNNACIALLDRFFRLPLDDARIGFKLFQTFCSQMDDITKLLKHARIHDYGRHIPDLKKAPTSLLPTLEKYLENPGNIPQTDNSIQQHQTNNIPSLVSPNALFSNGGNRNRPQSTNNPISADPSPKQLPQTEYANANKSTVLADPFSTNASGGNNPYMNDGPVEGYKLTPQEEEMRRLAREAQQSVSEWTNTNMQAIEFAQFDVNYNLPEYLHPADTNTSQDNSAADFSDPFGNNQLSRANSTYMSNGNLNRSQSDLVGNSSWHVSANHMVSEPSLDRGSTNNNNSSDFHRFNTSSINQSINSLANNTVNTNGNGTFGNNMTCNQSSSSSNQNNSTVLEDPFDQFLHISSPNPGPKKKGGNSNDLDLFDPMTEKGAQEFDNDLKLQQQKHERLVAEHRQRELKLQQHRMLYNNSNDVGSGGIIGNGIDGGRQDQQPMTMMRSHLQYNPYIQQHQQQYPYTSNGSGNSFPSNNLAFPPNPPSQQPNPFSFNSNQQPAAAAHTHNPNSNNPFL